MTIVVRGFLDGLLVTRGYSGGAPPAELSIYPDPFAATTAEATGRADPWAARSSAASGRADPFAATSRLKGS